MASQALGWVLSLGRAGLRWGPLPGWVSAWVSTCRITSCTLSFLLQLVLECPRTICLPPHVVAPPQSFHSKQSQL